MLNVKAISFGSREGLFEGNQTQGLKSDSSGGRHDVRASMFGQLCNLLLGRNPTEVETLSATGGAYYALRVIVKHFGAVVVIVATAPGLVEGIGASSCQGIVGITT